MPNGSMIFHGSTILLTSSTLNYGDKIRLRSDFDGQMAGLRWQHRAGCSWHMPALNVHEPVDRWHQLRQSLRLQVKAATDMVQVDGPHGVFWRFLKGVAQPPAIGIDHPPMGATKIFEFEGVWISSGDDQQMFLDELVSQNWRKIRWSDPRSNP